MLDFVVKEDAMSDGKPLRSWGVVYQSGIRRSNDHECQNCEKSLFGSDHLVGFDYSPEGSEKIGKLIVECPDCGERFWWHIRTEHLTDYMQLPQWPKG
jgi:hypothetical protein